MSLRRSARLATIKANHALPSDSESDMKHAFLSPLRQSLAEDIPEFVRYVLDQFRQIDMLTRSSPTYMTEKRALLKKILDFLSEQEEMLRHTPHLCVTIRTQLEQMVATINEQQARMPFTYMTELLSGLYHSTDNVCSLFPDLESTFQEKLFELEDAISVYHEAVQARSLLQSINRICTVLDRIHSL